MKKTLLLILLIVTMLCSGCRPEPFTNVYPLTDFLILDNGNVEIVWVENGRYRTIIVKPEVFHLYEGESEIVTALIDGYVQTYVYLNPEDYERFLNETIGGEQDGE